MTKLSKDAWVMLSLVVFLILVAVFVGYQQDNGGTREFDPRRTSYSTAAAGLMGLYETLDELDYRVRRHIDDLTVQPEDGILFLISPGTPLSEDEQMALRGWVERGNTLVVVSSSDYAIPSLEKRPKVHRTGPTVPSFLAPDVRSFNVSGVNRIDRDESVFDDALACNSGDGPATTPSRAMGRSDKPRIPEKKDKWVSLMGDKSGATAVYTRWGRGEVIMLSESWPLTNAGIKSGDNLVMVMNAINHRTPDRKLTVTFDEFHHGYGRGEGILSLINGPARWGLAMILVGFVLMIFATSRRFGVPVHLHEGVRQRGEYLGSMSSLLRRAKATGLVRKRLGRRFMEDAARAVGLPPHAGADDIVAAARQRRPDIADQLRKLVIEAASVNTHEDENTVLALARAWHRMRKELTK